MVLLDFASNITFDDRPLDENGKPIVTPNDPPLEDDGYKAPKGKPEKDKTNNGAKGWKYKHGNIWVPAPTGTRDAHGGGHWDVVRGDGKGYINVYPSGKIRKGKGKRPIFKISIF